MTALHRRSVELLADPVPDDRIPTTLPPEVISAQEPFRRMHRRPSGGGFRQRWGVFQIARTRHQRRRASACRLGASALDMLSEQVHGQIAQHLSHIST